MKVVYKGGEHLTDRTGEVVGYVNVPSDKPQEPIGRMANRDAVPNIWAVIVDNETGMFLSLPLYKVIAIVGDA